VLEWEGILVLKDGYYQVHKLLEVQICEGDHLYLLWDDYVYLVDAHPPDVFEANKAWILKKLQECRLLQIDIACLKGVITVAKEDLVEDVFGLIEPNVVITLECLVLLDLFHLVLQAWPLYLTQPELILIILSGQ
jgi:hypothetical protein